VAVIAATASPALADPVDGNLPGGTSIQVSIDSPADGTILPPGPVTITGTASVAMAEPVALIYVLDVSGSTDNEDIAGCGGDQNGDGASDRVLDCEILAARTLNGVAVDSGAVSEVGAVVFASAAAAADVRPEAGDQPITGPAVDLDSDTTRDIEQVIATTFSEFGGNGGVTAFTPRSVGVDTNFADAITATTAVAAGASPSRKIVAFLSDGIASTGGSIQGPLDAVPDDVAIFTFAAGPGASCTNTGENGEGSLDQITKATVGPEADCTPVPDAASLPDLVPGVIESELSTLTLSVDGGAGTPITDLTPPLPQPGPASVDYSVSTAPLAPGIHDLCVTAAGSDFGGEDEVTDCHTVIINAPPEVDAGGPYAGQEGTPVGIAGTVTDPDSPGVTQEWTVTPTANVDPGTTCAFADATAESTSITCTDDGTFTLTLTADDGINPPVSDTATLELTNVAPAVDISAPDDGALFAAGTPVEFVAPFTDDGSNDTHSCTVDFDDGTPVAAGSVDQSPGSGTCTITHSFTALGPHDVLVTVTDDDGGSATAVVTVVIFLPGEAFAIEANGPVTIPKTPHATCPPDESLTQVQLNAAIATVNALNADCTVDPGTGETIAAASVEEASLLGGVVTISNIESTCQSSAEGITRSSSVGTINGVPIGLGSGSITIPLVAQVFYNETTTTADGKLAQNAIRVRTLLGQEIILAGCRLG
jgi:hypothetical protein